MRLQLAILRNSLPPVQIIFTTGSGPASHTTSRSISTVADLLHDVNNIVPLESEGGEWGLEDYVVEVAATLEQELSYECLHFQTLKSVLREDDEVTIRPLTTDELRVRRLGGRHQISGDGRHLIDGVAFGKRWLRIGARPGIVIPPRKKRRMEIEGDDSVMQITENGHDWSEGALVKVADEDEEDEGDDDFSDGPAEEPAGQVALREVFEDADESSEYHESEDDRDELEDELQLLLKDAAEIEKAESGEARGEILERQLRATRPSKRKRELDDDGGEDSDDVFEGFATPAKGSSNQILTSIVHSDQEQDIDSSESDLESISDSEPDRMLEMVKNGIKKTAQGEPIDPDLTSSSGITSSDSEDSDLTSSSSISASDDIASSSGSDSDSEHDSDSDSSSSSGSDSSSESDEESSSRPKSPQKPTLEPLISSPAASTPAKLKSSPPGQGKIATQNRNHRSKLRKQLAALKAEGILPAEANFEDLRAYESSSAVGVTAEVESESDVEAARLRLLEQFKSPIKLVDEMVSQHQSSTSKSAEIPVVTADTAKSSAVGRETVTSDQTTETPDRRPRLDVASSRRMLFSSLGLRTPKTPEAEQTLREKLSQAIRHDKPRLLSDVISTEFEDLEVLTDDTWMQKLVVSAVECEREGVIMGPPPFPFEQRWSKGKGKVANRSERRHGSNHIALENESRSSPPHDRVALDVSTPWTTSADNAPRSRDESRTVSFENQEAEIMAIPTNFEALPALEKAHLIKGALIAYKELHVSSETNFQPEISPYRVARVTQSEEKGSFTVLLARKYRKPGLTYDEETGERVYSKFEVVENEDDEDVDDGARELEFGALIQPKLVEVSGIHVPDSNPAAEATGAETVGTSQHGESAYIPESTHGDLPLRSPAPSQSSIQQVESSAARRNEITTIIREAAFASSVKKDALLSEPTSRTIGDLLDSDSASDRINPPISATPEHDTDRAAETRLSTPPPVEDTLIPASYHDPHRPEIYLNCEEVRSSSNSVLEFLPIISSKDTSSHQDAQRSSPAPQVGLELTVSEGKEKVALQEPNRANSGHSSFLSLALEVPQLLSQQNDQLVEAAEESMVIDQQETPSFLGALEYDGRDSSYHNSHDEEANASDSQSSLPSLRELLSSQPPRKIAKANSETLRLSPPKPKSMTVPGRKKQRLSMPSSSDNELDLPPSSQRSIKLSHSQQAIDSRPLSQIPVVDLTTTSENASLAGSDLENPNSGMASTKSTQYDPMVNGTSKANSKAKLSSVSLRAAGLGTRRLLTVKKKKQGGKSQA